MLQPKKKEAAKKELFGTVKEVFFDDPVNAAKKTVKNFTKEVTPKRTKELGEAVKDVFIDQPLNAAKRGLKNAKDFVNGNKK